jgi:hypothetical protein
MPDSNETNNPYLGGTYFPGSYFGDTRIAVTVEPITMAEQTLQAIAPNPVIVSLKEAPI